MRSTNRFLSQMIEGSLPGERGAGDGDRPAVVNYDDVWFKPVEHSSDMTPLSLRREILAMLREGPMTAADMAVRLCQDPKRIKQNLSQLVRYRQVKKVVTHGGTVLWKKESTSR